MPIILKNATFINWQTLEFSFTNILVNEGLNSTIEFVDDLNQIPELQNHNIIDCHNKFITKSFVVGHHHAYSALATGMPAPKPTPTNFHEILKYLWWKLDKALDKEMIEASALATAISCAKAGSTFVIDHHASPNFIDGSLEILAKAFEKVGIQHLLCYEISDRDGLDKSAIGLQETEYHLKNHQGLVGLHASFTLSDNTLKQAAGLMEKYKSGIHIHVAEDKHDQDECLKLHKQRVVERLNAYGLLNSSKSILGHCLHLSENERDIIKNSKAWIAQNIESNLNNKVGHFNSHGLGEHIFLGTDGMHSDMIRSAQWAHFAGQGFDNLAFGDAYFRLRNVHNYLKVNDFKGDGENNLIVLDYPSITPVNQQNFLGHFLFGLNSTHIQHVISNGKIIVEDRKFKTINEQEILHFTREQAKRLWDRIEEL